MKFLKKSKKAKKSKPTIGSMLTQRSDTPALDALVENGAVDGQMSELDVAKRKAEFLELLAKEERAHRVKLAEMRNEPIKDRRQSKPAETSASEAPKRIPLPPSPSFDTPEPELEPREPVARQTETETRAAIGKQIGGSDFLMGSAPSFKTPELEAKIEDTAEFEDVTPPPTAKTKAETVPPYADMDFSRPSGAGRANAAELRLDVSRIYTDIENGDALYRRAQQRVQGLMHFVDKAEVDFSLLERLEPENRRLKARNAMIGKELEDMVRKTSLIEADLDEHRRRLAEVNVQYDTVNGNLAKAMKALSERDREIREITNDISSLTLKLDREKTTTEVEVRENNVLRERVVNLTNDLEDAKAARADAGRIVESLKIDLTDHRAARERIETEAYDLRRALDEAQKQNNQMKSEMVALHQDISTFKTQYEFNLISRDDRITLLEAQIEDLARQLQVKEDIVASAAKDVTELRKTRTGGELERERLEKIIDSQSMQLEMAQKEISENQAAMQEMDTRYRDVAAALSITQNRRANQAPAKAPDIHPDMENAKSAASKVKKARRAERASDDYGTTATDPIEDHIIAYKLGLRKNLIPAHLAPLIDAAELASDTSEPRPAEPRVSTREDGFEALDQETIEDRIMDYKLGLRKNIF